MKIGLFCSTPMVPLSRAVGRKRALEMLLTGRADRRGDRAASGASSTASSRPTSSRTPCRSSSRRSRRSSPLTVRIGKEAFYAQIELDEHRAYDLTKAVMAMNALADDAQEGICAFLEKRPPAWRGR